jgi:hypothetical protein
LENILKASLGPGLNKGENEFVKNTMCLFNNLNGSNAARQLLFWLFANPRDVLEVSVQKY